MDKEKRTGVKPIPDDLKEVLNEAQWQTMKGVECSGWVLKFVRRPLFQEPLLVLHNPNDDRIWILDKDGRIKIQSNIKARELEKPGSDSTVK